MSSLRLGIDTSAGIAVGLARGGEVVARAFEAGSRQHVERLVPLVASVCGSAGFLVADVDEVVVGMGPGPFTGLRAGIAAAYLLAEGIGASVRGVCSLDAIARAVPGGVEFCVVSDARRGEVYWASYAADGARVGEPRVGVAAGLPELPLAGPGVPEALAAQVPVGWPRDVDGGVLALVGGELPEIAEPLYLRAPDAVAPTARKSVLANRAGRVRLRATPG